MAETITYTTGVQVADGPSILKTANISVEAYDVVNACIEKESSALINLQPSVVPEDIVVVFIVSDSYADLTYTASGAPITLDKPQMYLGGQVALLTATSVITFINASPTVDANIRIFCGRLAETAGE